MQQITDLLIQQYLYDIHVMSQPWLYQWLLIPAIAYMVFMGFKWVVLTLPLWLPLSLVISAWRNS